MTCRDARGRIAAYADGELGVEASIGLEAHLERCADCLAAFRRERALSRAIHQLYPREGLPAELESRLLGTPRRLAARWLAVAAVAVTIVAASWLFPSGEVPLGPDVRSALAAHHAAERGELALGLASEDLGRVNRWLEREIPFAVPIPHGDAGRFRLAGAASVDLGGEQAGYVLYRRGDDAVSLFVRAVHPPPAGGRLVRFRGMEFRVIETAGHRVVAWSHPPVSYLLVSSERGEPASACAVCHLGQAGIAGFADTET